MATQGTSGEDSPTPASKRERKPNIRLGDLGESKPSSRQLRARNPRSTDPSPDSGTKKQTETPSSGLKRSKRSSPRSADPSPGSGTEKQKETPESEPKRSKPSTPRNRPSTEPSPNSGTEKQKETHESDPKRSKPSTILKRRSTEPSPNSGKQLKTPDSVFKRPHDKPPADNLGTEYGMEITLSELKRPRDKSPANNSGLKNQQESSNGPARAMISGPIMDINVSRGAHDVAAKANDCISQNGGSQLAEMGGVHGWLERLGLAKYKRTFDSHEVDETALPLLTVKDLINMGITAVGSRRKLYCAIQELKKGL